MWIERQMEDLAESLANRVDGKTSPPAQSGQQSTANSKKKGNVEGADEANKI